MKLHLPITKVDAVKREVYGRAAQQVLDKSGEIMDYETSKPLFQKWSDGIAEATNGKSLGNVRAMHSKIAAGKLIQLVFDDKEQAIDVVAKIVDDAEWKKVEESVYTGFSIGGSYAKRWEIDGVTHYTADPAEVSLVDNPAIPTAVFSLIKMDAAKPQENTMSKKTDDENKGEYGTHAEAGYADPGYQDDEKPRYPLKEDGKLSPERIRAAWSYIHQEKNAEPYTEKEIARIKSRIVSAWKKEIDPEGPPSADEDAEDVKKRREREDAHKMEMRTSMDGDSEPDDDEKTRREKIDKADEARRKDEDKSMAEKSAAGDLQKGMNSVSALAQVISSVAVLRSTAEWESEQENDNSPIPGKLKAAIELLGEVLTEMTEEEIKELMENPSTPNPYPSMYLAAPTDGLEKRGARHSKQDKEKIQQIHALLIELGIDPDETSEGEGAEKAASTSLEKVTSAYEEKLEKMQAKHADEMQKVLDRVEALEKQPAPAKGVAKAIGKTGDSDDEPREAPVVYTPKGEKSEPASMIKMLHLSGGRPLLNG